MPRGSTASTYSLQERKDIANQMFARGSRDSDVADYLDVHPDTVARYRKEYEEALVTQARNNPHMLTDVLLNTMRSLDELDEVRKEAWREYENPHASRQHRAQMLNTVIRAQKQRAELFGLFGVKAEFFAHVQNVRIVQGMIIEWLQQNLCEDDREALAVFLEDPQVSRFMQQSDEVPELPVGEILDQR